MSLPSSAPARVLPERPDLAQLRKQAKELLRDFRKGLPAAVAEVQKFERIPSADFALADAQRVLARAYGFASWNALKEHVEAINAEASNAARLMRESYQLRNIEAFNAALAAGDLATIRRLVGIRPELVHEGTCGGYGALRYAVLQRDAALTKVLMDHGAEARTGIWPHRDATSAWTLARDRGYDDIVGIIEAEEARRRRQLSAAVTAPDTAASQASGPGIDEVIKLIVTRKRDEAIRVLESNPSLIAACNNGGATPLHAAAWVHDPDLAAWLLDRGAPALAAAVCDVPYRPAEKAEGPRTPLDQAALVAGTSAHGRHYTFMENHSLAPDRFERTVSLLLSRGARLTPWGAVATGNRHAIEEMHRAGALKNEIHWLRGGLLSIAARVNRLDMVKLLLDLGLDVNEAVGELQGEPGDHSSGMPLWFAALCGRLEIAELLLDRGADVNACVYASGDALGNAQHTKDEPMQKLLLSRGAHITVEQVPDRATARGILDGTIKAHSLNVLNPTFTDLAEQMLWANSGHDAEVVRMCLPYIRRKKDDTWWNYVLVHARLPETVQVLLEYGIDPNVLSDGGYTLLHHLATAYAADDTRLARAELLLKSGASLAIRDPLLRSTPLGWACRWGRLDLVRLYLAYGADPGEADAEPWATPLAWAEKGGHGEIVVLLQAAGAK